MGTTVKIDSTNHRKLRQMKALGDFDTYNDLISYLIKAAHEDDFSIAKGLFRRK